MAGPYAQTPLTQFILDRKKFYSELSAEDLDVGGYINTDNLQVVGRGVHTNRKFRFGTKPHRTKPPKTVTGETVF